MSCENSDETKLATKNGSKIVISLEWEDEERVKGINAESLQKRYRFAAGRDLLTPPHTKTDCSKICENKIPPFKYCCEYTTYYQWMYVDWYLIINLADQKDIDDAVNDCLHEAAIVSLISAIIAAYAAGGGAALESAKASFVATVIACLNSKVAELSLISAWVETQSHWGDWETH
jgi:hypothetical protein